MRFQKGMQMVQLLLNQSNAIYIFHLLKSLKTSMDGNEDMKSEDLCMKIPYQFYSMQFIISITLIICTDIKKLKING